MGGWFGRCAHGEEGCGGHHEDNEQGGSQYKKQFGHGHVYWHCAPSVTPPYRLKGPADGWKEHATLVQETYYRRLRMKWFFAVEYAPPDQKTRLAVR